MKKRLLSIALAMSMIFSCFTAIPVFAEKLDSLKPGQKAAHFDKYIEVSGNNGNITFKLTPMDSYNTTGKSMYLVVVHEDWLVIFDEDENGIPEAGLPDQTWEVDQANENGNGSIHVSHTWTNADKKQDEGGGSYYYTCSQNFEGYSTAEGTKTKYLCFYWTGDDGNEAATYSTFELDNTGSVVVPHATLTLNLNGGAFTPAKTSVDVTDLTKTYTATDLGTLIGTPTKANSVFKGWSSTQLNSGNNYGADATVDTLGEFTDAFDDGNTYNVYAVWQDKAALANTDFELNPDNKNYTGANITTTVQKKSSVTGTVGAITNIKYGGAAAAKNADTYTVTFDVAESDDYKSGSFTLTNAFTVNKAAYSKTQPTGTIPLGTTIQGFEFDGTIDGVNGETLAGTFKITSASGSGDTDTVANTSNKSYTGLNYEFTPSGTASNNYTALTNGKFTGSDAKLTAATADAVTVTITEPNDKTYDGTDKKATVTVQKGNATLTAGTDYTVAYVTVNGSTETPTTDVTNAATYKVTVTLDSKYSTTDALTKTYTIDKKEVSVNLANSVTVSKVFDGTQNVTKADGTALAVTDLALGNVIAADTADVALAADGTFTAQYADATPAEGVKKFNVTPATVKLTGTKADNYKLPTTIELDGKIVCKTIMVVTPKTDLKYKGSAYDAKDLVDVKIYANPTDAANPDVTTLTEVTDKFDVTCELGTGVTAEDASTTPYTVTVTAAAKNNNTDYDDPASKTADVTIGKAEYTYTGTIQKTGVTTDTDLQNTGVTIDVDANSAVKVLDVDGAVVPGTITIKSTAPVTLTKDQTITTGLTWAFTPTTADTNYEALTGTTATVKTETSAPTFTITVNTAGDKGNSTAKATVDGNEVTEAKEDDEVTITAEPDTGYEVDTITSDDVTVTNGAFTMPANAVTVTVTFKKSEYTITDGTTAPNGKLVFKDAAGNEIDPATAKLNTGDVVTVVVDPDDGYELDGALDAKDTTNGDAPVAIDANGNFTMPAGNVTVTAPAFKKSNYKVTPVNPTGDANGKFTVNTSTTQITAQKDDTITVDVSDVTSGYNVSVTATYTKTGETTTTSVPVTTVTAGTQYTFTMPAADVEVKVAFTKKPSGGGGGGVTSTYRVTYNPGKNGTIAKGVKTTESVASGSSPKAVPEIVPNEGYTFKGWTIDGETIVVPTEEKIKKATTFTALYEEAAAATPTPVPTEEPDTGDHKLYIHGYAEDGSFRADNPVTRAEVATMFALALTDFTEGKTYNNPYWDIDPNAWYADYILSLTELGAITGYDDSSFMPDQYITRQEFAAMLTRLGDVLPAEEMPFYDVSSENWGIDYIYTAYANGWVIGYEDGTFRPDRNISRTEAVKMVNGYLGRVVDATTVEGIDYNVFYDVPTNHWGYYEILEAANDHTYTVGTKPEKWVSVN